jgi:hypothetical protein
VSILSLKPEYLNFARIAKIKQDLGKRFAKNKQIAIVKRQVLMAPGVGFHHGFTGKK